MAKPVDLIVGSIKNLEHDRCAGWEAFYRIDYENDKMKELIKKLKGEVKRLKKILRGDYK